MKIGFFDSGVGGLTVLREFLNILEKENNSILNISESSMLSLSKYPEDKEGVKYLKIYYLADLINAPYGTRNANDLLSIIHKNIDLLEHNYMCEYIVSACNSASAIYSKNINYTEMIKPTANFCKLKNYKKSLLIATPATINSKIYQKEFEKLNINLDTLAMSNLASLIEEGTDEETIEKYIILELEKNKTERQKLNKSFDYNIYDNIILGCTHYPLVKDIFKEIFKQNILDPSLPVANEIFNNIKHLAHINLENINTKNKDKYKYKNIKRKVKLCFIQTKESEIFKNKVENMFVGYEYVFM